MDKILDSVLGIATSFISGLFGKSKTKKTLAVLDAQADALMIREAKQSQILTVAKFALIGIAAVILIFIVMKGRK